MTDNETSNPSIDRMFMGFLDTHKNGKAITEVSAALKQATAATQLTGKKSSVTLAIEISPASKGTANTLVLLTKVKTRLPEEEQAASIYYADHDFNLVRNDPNQHQLPLREVKTEDEGKRSLREVEAK